MQGSDRELLKAGKVPLRVIGVWDDFAAINYAPIEIAPENFQKRAQLKCAEQVVLGNMTKAELRIVLKMLGLL